MTNDSSVRGIFHTVIGVSDMTQALSFYQDVLGLRVTFDDYHDPEAISRLFEVADPVVHSVVLECPDGTELELIEYERPRGAATDDRRMWDAGLVAMALRVEGLTSLTVRVADAGYEMPTGLVEQVLPDGSMLKVVVVTGPDGATIILVEPPPGRRSLAPN
jgi:catechol 2,3-dioxygenase-like lactoylglutathione lyase family enzyme